MISSLAVCLLAVCLVSVPASAETVSVGVASNFHHTAKTIAEAFEAETGHRVRISPSSSGKLFAQIVNGAPFDIFLSADSERPQRLEAMELAVADSRTSYALGKLVLWSADPRYEGRDCLEALRDGDFSRLAIANPRIAPYGLASQQVLLELGVETATSDGRLALGENVLQTLQFVASGNASMGLIAAPQLQLANVPASTCQWEVPVDMHAPIEQQLVLLRRGADNSAAVAFLEYLRQDAVRTIILDDGYMLAD